jgi:hydroxymethylpyrimidine kinase/phosphomethylpyrimidine kinase/thiamine-phosphate diphosphorylase
MNPQADASAAPLILWTIAGTDSGGGAGIAADQRAADASGVHLCTVVAAVTAQNSMGVPHIELMTPQVIGAQIRALEADMPPRAIKTGLLGGPAQIEAVALAIDRVRAAAAANGHTVPLIVDPVLGATSGASFADDTAVAAYRRWMFPRATLLTPNRMEALRLTGMDAATATAPQLAKALRNAGCAAVVITGGDTATDDGLARDWIETPHASGWLALPRIATRHTHATGCTFAAAAAAAMARGFVAADACVLAKMAAAHALRHGHAAGQGAGPAKAKEGFASDPSLMPQLSWGEPPRFAPFAGSLVIAIESETYTATTTTSERSAPSPRAPARLYAIADSADRIQALLAAGVRMLQLRIKTPPPTEADDAGRADLQRQIEQAVAACRAASPGSGDPVQLFINDHHSLALQAGAPGIHLGQEDLLAMTESQRESLLAADAPALGISSHSLWELARARSLAPAYIACGPVWPTLTKAMPWQAQALKNLGWWCRMAGAPVVAIGGILTPAQAGEAAACGAASVCVVRGLGSDASLKDSVAGFSEAMVAGAANQSAVPAAGWPHPSLVD